MILLLAESNPAEVGSWVLILFTVVNGLAALGGLVANFATRREVEQLEKRLDGQDAAVDALRDEMHKMNKELRDKMDVDKTEVLHAGSVRAGNLHTRCDQILANESEMKGELKVIADFVRDLMKKGNKS